jgi:transcriptional regulator with XRE-family HTH domain
VKKERAPRPPRTEAEEKLLQALRERFAQDGRSISEIERLLNLGHGTLSNVLRGRSELRLHHLETLGAVLQFTFLEIVAEAYGITGKKGDLPA